METFSFKVMPPPKIGTVIEYADLGATEILESDEIDLRLSIVNLLEEKVTHRTRLNKYRSSTVSQAIHSIKIANLGSSFSLRGISVPSCDDISVFGTVNIKRQLKRIRSLSCAEDHEMKRPRRHSPPQSLKTPMTITNQVKSDSFSQVSKHNTTNRFETPGVMQVLQKNAGICCHIDDRRRIRERERELDRLGRLLRRAAELDVSRCCNDVRTLLLARGHSEELGLQIPSPPTSQGQIQLNLPPMSLNYRYTSQINKSTTCSALNFPFPVSLLPLAKRCSSYKLESLESMNIILQVSDFLHTFRTSIRHQMKELPNIAELIGALAIMEGGHPERFRSAYKMLSSVAMALLDASLPSLATFWGVGRLNNITKAPLIDINEITWQALARLSILITAFRELGFTDSDTLPEVCGSGGWMSQPNSDSADYTTLALIKERIYSVECQHRAFKSKPELLVHIPIPRRHTSDQIPQSRIVITGKEVIGQDFRVLRYGSTRFTLIHSRSLPQLKNSTPSLTQWCSTVIDILSAQPEAKKLHHIAENTKSSENSGSMLLANIQEAVLRGRYSNSLADFVADVRRVFHNCHCYMQEGCDSMQAVTKLGAIFERLLREKNLNISTETYFKYCAGCRSSSQSTSSRFLRCNRCDAHYHLSCLQVPLNSVPQDWFCPTCVSLVRGPGAADRIACNTFETRGVRFIVKDVLLPSCNTLLSTPHLIVKRDDGKHFQMLSEKLVHCVSLHSLPPSSSVENAGWALPGGGVPYKLNPSYSQHAANKCKQNNEFRSLLRATRALSSDNKLKQHDWIAILGSLVSCATAAFEMNMCLSDHLAENRDDLLDEPMFLVSDVDEDKSISKQPSLEDTLIEIPSGNQRKQRELLLVAGVVQDAVSFVKIECVNNIEGTSPQLEANAQRGIMQDLLSMGDLHLPTGSVMNPVVPRGTCVWCGGDYGYLRSAFVPAQQELKMSRIFHRSCFLVLPKTQPTGLALTHEFCSNCLTGQRAGALSRKRERTSMIYKEKLLFAGKGRTQPLGTDTHGRMYWYFTQHTNVLGVQLPSRKKLHNGTPLLYDHDKWLCYCTVPSIAQLIFYLIEICNEQIDMLLHGMMLAFPEACNLIEPRSDFLDYIFDDLIWSRLEIGVITPDLLSSALSAFQQAYLKIGKDVLVRVGELVWSATLKDIRICELNGIAYCVHYKQWSSSFDEWLTFERLLFCSVITCRAQKRLFQDRVLPNLMSTPKQAFDHFKLQASGFIGKPFRVQVAPPSEMFEPFDTGNQNHHIRSALLTICGALPAGSITPRCSQFIHKHAYRIKQASSTIELTELFLALEDSLNKSWLRSSWSTIRSCLPTRTYILKYASLSQVALLIWVLDNGIIYDQVQMNMSSLPIANDYDQALT